MYNQHTVACVLNMKIDGWEVAWLFVALNRHIRVFSVKRSFCQIRQNCIKIIQRKSYL